ncbi:MAG: metallophosphoesterase [Paludibacteraceae bacterium]|nr:metallophosphoesterase [Paludibacteraceae bacterium]
MNKLVVVGDIHLSEKSPKKEQGVMFLDWLFENELNNENNDLLLLGDLCNINTKPEVYGIYIDCFVNRSKFHSITIINGNHDSEMQDTILSIFQPLKNVSIVLQPQVLTFGKLRTLCLPHYNHQGTDMVPMIDRYTNLYTETGFQEYFDFGFGHIEDQTNHFGKTYPDTSKLNVNTWMNGHLHTEDITKGGHYLGSVTLNSSAENGKDSYVAVVDEETKSYELKLVPKFLGYYEVSYPDNIPEITTPLAIFTVKESLDKEESISFYQEKAKEQGIEFHTRLVQNKKIESSTIDSDRKDLSVESHLDDFIEKNMIEAAVADICKTVLKRKETL